MCIAKPASGPSRYTARAHERVPPMKAQSTLNQPIQRTSLNWLLVAQALVIVPFALHVPVALIVLWLACTFWRIQAFRMRVRNPGTWIKSGLLVGTAGGIFLARGSLVGLSSYVTQRDARWFPEPERFDPERFLPPRIDQIQAGAYFPFGMGPAWI